MTARAPLIRLDKALSSTTSVRASRPRKDPALCSTCHAVWHRGKWSQDASTRRDVRQWGTPISVACPACQSAKEGIPTGILYLAGAFVAQNRGEILNLVRNTTQAAAARNPLERILRIGSEPRFPLVVETTSEKLARRIGRAVKKACAGSLHIRFSHEDKLVRVYWRRDTGSET